MKQNRRILHEVCMQNVRERKEKVLKFSSLGKLSDCKLYDLEPECVCREGWGEEKN